MDEFLKNLLEILETDATLGGDTVLSEIEEWNSLSVVTFLAMADMKYEKTISLDELDKAKTVSDLYGLVSH